jgi:DNA recombination protein RmuC
MIVETLILTLVLIIILLAYGIYHWHSKYTQANNQSIALKVEIKLLQQSSQQQQDFEKMAEQVLLKTSHQLNEKSEQSFSKILSPLRDRLTEFNTKLDDTFKQHAKEQFGLKQEIDSIVKLNQSMQQQTADLTQALRGDKQSQGAWGEIILERLLDQSGLRKNEDYILQGEGMSLKHTESGGHLKPDAIIKLPDDKHIIVDAKTSLVDYQTFCNSDDEGVQKIALNRFYDATKAHIKKLAERRYQDATGLGSSPDFVLMFMPVEAAYALILQQYPELQNIAWENKIVIVCPSTLFATLHTVASIWRLEKQNKNTEKIAEEGGKLYDKFCAFVDDMQKIDKSLEQTRKHYDLAINKLKNGSGNIIGRTEKLRDLGVKTNKQLALKSA